MKPARLVASEALCAVLDGASLARALPPRLSESDNPPLTQELVYGALRWHFHIEGLLGQLLERPIRDKDRILRCLLHVGLYQLMEMDLPPHAAVNETVAVTRALKRPWARGLVNAVLRRYQREAERLEASLDEADRLSHPRWLLERLRQAWPNEWQRICEENNRRPPMVLRVNRLRQSRDAYLQQLAAEGIEARPHPCSEVAIELARPVPVEALPGFADGAVSVQDAAAQLAARFLDPQPGERVLDACAAPGGKTAHLLEHAGGDLDLLALEMEPARLPALRETLERLGLEAEIRQGDAACPDDWWDGRPFDRILLDAPCSATGVLRRNPDIRVHRRPQDIDRLQATQQSLLNALWPLLRPGGRLLYATCSVLPEENRERVAELVAGQADARLLPLPADCGSDAGCGLQILPGDEGMDGFFHALIEKRRDS